MNLTTGLTFAINVFLIGIIKTDEYVIYLIAYVILSTILWAMLEYSLYKDTKVNLFSFKFSWQELSNNVSAGILLLLGNFSSHGKLFECSSYTYICDNVQLLLYA